MAQKYANFAISIITEKQIACDSMEFIYSDEI